MHRIIPTACVFYLVSIICYVVFFYPGPTSQDFQELFNKKITIAAKVVSYASVRPEKTVVFVVQKIHTNQYSNEKIYVRIDKAVQLQYGDHITLTGTIKKPESFITETGRVFQYPEFLAAKNTYAVMKAETIVLHNAEECNRGVCLGGNLIRGLQKIKRSIVETISKILPDDAAALLAGIGIGEDALFSDTLAENFQVAGLSHIIVLSGYNILLVVTALMHVFSQLGFLYTSRRVMAIGGVVLFVLMTGTGASSVRAGIMSSIGLMLQISTRPHHAWRVLLYTLTIMTLMQPLALIYDPSLHLSFIASLAILYAVPIASRYCIKGSWIERSWAHATVTLLIETTVVQIIVLPYIIWMSGTFSVVSLIANLLTVPLVPYVMMGGLIGVVIAWMHLQSAQLLITPIEYLLNYIITIADWVRHLDAATITVEPIGYGWIIAWYCMVGIIMMIGSKTNGET